MPDAAALAKRPARRPCGPSKLTALASLQLRAKTEALSYDEIMTGLAALPADERLIHWSDTGIPLSQLAGFVARNGVNDPIGGMIGRELYINLDWRLPALQKRLGVAETKLPDAEDE
jgi:hypothetical protein